jgi:ribosomal protein S1
VVAQTTFKKKIWENCKKILKKHYTNAKIFDTICDATAERQNEATALAGECDFMVVIGGRHSSNTRKLYDICSELSKTVLVESAKDLVEKDYAGAHLICVTAGASTPAGIIKEVLKTMSETIKTEDTKAVETAEIQEAADKATTPDDAAVNQAAEAEVVKSFDDMTFEEALEASLNGMSTNQKVKGYVVAVTPTEVQVDIGRKYTGYVPANELSNDPNEKPEDVCKVGDTIDLIIMHTNDQEGIITLSKRRFDAEKGFETVAAAAESGEILEGKVTAVVKGGLTMSCNGCRVFVPASHATLTRGEALEPLVGTTQKFKVLEIGRGRRVVGSIRQVLREQKKAENEALWANLKVGDTYTGTVKSITSYGVFVDIGGADGMIHISELSWKRIKHPSDVVSVGDEIVVFIKDLDFEKHKISLGYRKDEDNPWFILKSKYKVGDVATVKIVSMTSYGAFANLIPGIDGLIHISQIADRRIEKPQDVLSVGDEVQVKITEIDYDKKRVSLSMRALIEPKAEEKVVEEAAVEETSGVLYSTEAPEEVPEGLVDEDAE